MSIIFPLQVKNALSIPEIWELLKGKKLIVPTVSFANVSQLATDLLIVNLECRKVARINQEHLYPFVSPQDHAASKLSESDSNDEVCTSLELYYSDNHSISIIQQRSPILPGFEKSYLDEVFIPFLSCAQISDLVILDSSSFAIVDSSFSDSINDRNIAIYSHLNSDITDRLKYLKINDSDKILDIPTYTNNTDNTSFIRTLLNSYCMVSNGATKAETDDGAKIDNKCIKTASVTVLQMFVFEGDNFEDASNYFFFIMNSLLSVKIGYKDCVLPYSWSTLYGDKPIPVSMEEGIFC